MSFSWLLALVRSVSSNCND